jgi:hypothetical protein
VLDAALARELEGDPLAPDVDVVALDVVSP